MAKSSEMADLIHQVDAVAAQNYAPLPVVLHAAEGVWLVDTNGRRYLDMLAAYGAVNHGHQHPRLLAALVEQAGTPTYPAVRFAFHSSVLTGKKKPVNLPSSTE